jgi:hypothetical protein
LRKTEPYAGCRGGGGGGEEVNKLQFSQQVSVNPTQYKEKSILQMRCSMWIDRRQDRHDETKDNVSELCKHKSIMTWNC